MEENSLEKAFLDAVRSFSAGLEHAVTDLSHKFDLEIKELVARATASTNSSIEGLKETISDLEAEKEHHTKEIAYLKSYSSVLLIDKASMEEEISTLRGSIDKMRSSRRQITANFVQAKSSNNCVTDPGNDKSPSGIATDEVTADLFTGPPLATNEAANANHVDDTRAGKKRLQLMINTRQENVAKKMKHEEAGNCELQQLEVVHTEERKDAVDGVEAQDDRRITLMEVIKKAQPWNKMYSDSPKFSHTFDYTKSPQAVKNWVSKVRLVQSKYRQGYWAQMHYRKGLTSEFDGQITTIRRAYRELCDEANKLIGSGMISEGVLMEPFFWKWHTNTVYLPNECKSLGDLEALDERTPFLVYYTNNIAQHHFYAKVRDNPQTIYLLPDLHSHD